MALNSNHALTQIQIYISIIVVGVPYTDSYYVDTIPVVQEQPYDQYDIAQNTGTNPVEHKSMFKYHNPAISYWSVSIKPGD
jgi:hypothetical protein